MKLFNSIKNYILDPAKDFKERNFVLLTMVAGIAVFLAMIADILLGENIVEIIILGATATSGPIVSWLVIKKHWVRQAGIFMSFMTVFFVLPIAFFFGGGLYGGAVIWIAFAFLYIGLIAEGGWRRFFLLAIVVITSVEFYLTFYKSYLIIGPHTKRMMFMDTLVAIILVGLLIYMTVMTQNMLFIAQNEQAKEYAKQVEELNRSQNSFFSNMSHEIRTPINTIIGLNEMILREEVSDEVAEDAANIQAAGKMLLHLINDILDMSKLESGQMQLTNVAYNPGNMLSDIVGMLWLRAKDKGLEFHIDVAHDIPSELYGDEIRIKQILINILNNAIKYTGQGSVTLSIQCEKKEDGIAYIVYSVTDTGMGIKKEDIPYLFTAFKRVDEGTNRHIEGTGLGLSIVKQLLDVMGGSITVNSIYTKGSTFVVSIPQKILNDKEIGELDMEERHKLNRREEYKKRFEAPDAKVLVVDDNGSNLLVVQKLLRDTKVQLDSVSSGAEALKKTLDTEYHVIFMDHLMPEMDGIECHKRIRTQTGGLSRNSKIVALTANAGPESRILYEKEGFNGYLVKPVSGEALERELYRLLPKDIVVSLGDEEEVIEETMSWMGLGNKKKSIAITSESIADLPREIIERYDIATLPHRVYTENGVFKDGIEIETKGLLAYMENKDNKVETEAPGVEEHEAFFAKQLSGANNVVHIVLSSKVTKSGCRDAMEAARAFDNVTVIDSGHLSSGQGLLVIEACRLAEEGLTVPEIASELEKIKRKIHTSFIVDSLEFLARSNQVSDKISGLMKAFMARPTLVMKNGKMGVGRIFFGTRENAWKHYIDSCLTDSDITDKRMLFVTYVGLTKRDIDKIRKIIDEKASFEVIHFMQASPVIAVNCGPGTFGLLYLKK
ncbi:MAG: DegV family EDD domain-containing protein [Lachnospiraceae bacterium]|nr:DegV family EDD domain-containing protein [Lachnospiraceae bacterium]